MQCGNMRRNLAQLRQEIAKELSSTWGYIKNCSNNPSRDFSPTFGPVQISRTILSLSTSSISALRTDCANSKASSKEHIKHVPSVALLRLDSMVFIADHSHTVGWIILQFAHKSNCELCQLKEKLHVDGTCHPCELGWSSQLILYWRWCVLPVPSIVEKWSLPKWDQKCCYPTSHATRDKDSSRILVPEPLFVCDCLKLREEGVHGRFLQSISNFIALYVIPFRNHALASFLKKNIRNSTISDVAESRVLCLR